MLSQTAEPQQTPTQQVEPKNTAQPRHIEDELEAYKDITVSDMNVEGMPWYKSEEERRAAENSRDLGLTWREKLAIILGAYKAFLPIFVVLIIMFSIAFVLLMLYMKSHI